MLKIKEWSVRQGSILVVEHNLSEKETMLASVIVTRVYDKDSFICLPLSHGLVSYYCETSCIRRIIKY